MRLPSIVSSLVALLLLCSCATFDSAVAQNNIIWDETPEERQERMQWWTDARFGMFIHWGLYAMPARHEWVKRYENMTNEEYQIYFDLFEPDLYDPADWARQARQAGMKYAVITVKHHDGFNLFVSDYTDYHAGNTPIGRDLIAEWVDAFRAEGLGVGFYYSLIDWHHPHFTVDQVHPLNRGDRAEIDRLNEGRDMAIYREYMHNQVREILTNYGKIDILWLDYSYPGDLGKGRDDWDSVELLKMVRELQPHILVNDRLDLKEFDDGWDFTTPEQFMVEKWPEIDGERIPWETCQTFSGSWGYYRDEHSWKDDRLLLRLLIDSVSKGGNLLLNVGPTGRGTIDYRAEAALKTMGEWMKYHGRAIYGATQAPDEYQAPEFSLLTYNPTTHRLYIHLLDYPGANLLLPGLRDKIRYAQFLHDGSELRISEPYGFHHQGRIATENDVYLRLPQDKPNVAVPVIEIYLK